MKTKYKVLLFVLVICVILGPVLLTMPACCEKFDFSSTGQIGDTIGGITAPIVGLISIFLLYITLNSQLEFNKEQKVANTLSHILSLQENIAVISNSVEIPFTMVQGGQPLRAHGLFHVNILAESDVIFYSDTLRLVTSQIINLENLCKELLLLNTNKDIPLDIRKVIYRFADNQLDPIRYFYRNARDGKIQSNLKLDEGEFYDKYDLAEELFGKDPNKEMYNEHLKELEDLLKRCAVQ